ncbi:Pre-rRNA-processing protein esf2 [Aspergillus floccosus]
MTTRKRNDFLEIASSDDEVSDRGYDSEAEISKGRIAKRQRVSKTHALSGSEDQAEDSDMDFASDEDTTRKGKDRSKTVTASREDTHQDDHNSDDGHADDREGGDRYLDVSETADKSDRKQKKPLDKNKPAKKKKPGVVYLSSLPPYLKPFALKSMLETRGFGPITKVFLTPEVRPSSAPRRRSNKRKTYADGWVEFASKKTAKICAETLNASIVGGRKGSWYHDDVWNMKYLRGYSWQDLLEQIQRERNEREAKQRMEDMRARKEEKVFIQGVEKGKVLEGIQKKNEEKRRRKMAAADAAAAAEASKVGDNALRAGDLKVRRTFKQNEVKMGRDKIKGDQVVLEEDTKRVLGKIF